MHVIIRDPGPEGVETLFNVWICCETALATGPGRPHCLLLNVSLVPTEEVLYLITRL
jgi:hypothetical protein